MPRIEADKPSPAVRSETAKLIDTIHNLTLAVHNLTLGVQRLTESVDCLAGNMDKQIFLPARPSGDGTPRNVWEKTERLPPEDDIPF